MRVSRIYRLLRLITLLQGDRGYRVSDLAEELQVSRRTVFRDLNMLEMARIPYYFDAESGGYRIGRHFFLPPVNLTLNEALAVLVLTGRGRSSGKVPLLADSASAAVKIESVLPGAVRRHLGGMTGQVGLNLGPMSRHEGLDEMFRRLTDAVSQRRVCRIVYISFHERKQIVLMVHPLRLVFVSRAWYVVAWSVAHREVRTFKLGRIRRLDVTDKEFTPPRDFDPERCFGLAWSMIPEGRLYKVHLHFEPQVAGNVAEVGWHETQRVEWNDDGSIEFHVTVDGLGEITWWVLGYGDQVRVVAPRVLRRRVAQKAQAVLAGATEEGV